MMSCVLRRNPRRTDPLVDFAAVKKKAPSSREAIGPYSLVSRGVGKCATNEVVQFFALNVKKYTFH